MLRLIGKYIYIYISEFERINMYMSMAFLAKGPYQLTRL